MNEILFRQINGWAGQINWLDQLMIFSADKLGYALVAVVLAFVLINKNKYRDMAIVALSSAVVARFSFVALIRLFYYHPRPFLILQDVKQLMNHEIESSFPSGHAAFYFALATGVYLYNKKLGRLYFVLAGLMGFARIFVSVHWPLDILIGTVLGIGVAITTQSLWNKYQSKKLKV